MPKAKSRVKKDIIKIDSLIDIDFDVLGYVDNGLTVNIIKDGVLIEKKSLELPEKIVNVIKCKNPRCITSVEQEASSYFQAYRQRKGRLQMYLL